MSTLRVNAIQNTSTTDGGISINNSGHVTVDGVAMPSAGPLSNRNLIINGAMQVAQRGTSVATSDGTNEGYQTVDRFSWNFANSAGGAATVSQSTTVPDGQGFSNSFKIDVTTAHTPTTTQHTYIRYYAEAQDIRNSGWNYTDSTSNITLSFWARSTKAGTYCLWFRLNDSSPEQYYSHEYSLTANTWEKITVTLPGVSGAAINNDNGIGFSIYWILNVGPDRDGATAGSWYTTTGVVATDNQVNFFDSTDNDFYLTGVQLEVGSVATPFEHRSYGDELARCQRYYWNVFFGDDSSDNTIGQGTNWNGTASFYDLYPPVAMRTTPSLEASNTASYYIAYESGGSTNVSTITLDNSSTPNVFEIRANVSGSAGNALILRRQNAAAILRFSAEL